MKLQKDTAEAFVTEYDKDGYILKGRWVKPKEIATDWIPVSERQPRENQRVLVTVRGSDIIFPQEGETIEECIERQYREITHIGIAWIGSDGWYEDYFPMIVSPCAWMPLPEPWEGE